MASKKSPKTELVAICKLEFYRKQKNWKFCAQERKAKESKRRNKATNAKLNQTYNIAPASPKAETSLTVEPPDLEVPVADIQQNLDEAFVETETGTASESDEPVLEGQSPSKIVLDTDTEKPSSQLEPPGSPYSPRWSIQRWAEQHRLWDPEPPCPTLDPSCPTLVPTCPKRDSPSDDRTCAQPIQDSNCPIFDNNYNTRQQDIFSCQSNSNYPNFDSIYPTQYPSTKHLEQFDPKYGASLFYYNSNMCYHYFDVPYIEANISNFRHSERNLLDVPTSGVDVLNMGGEWDDDWCAGEGAAWSEPEWLAEVAAQHGRGGGGGGGRGRGRGAGGEDAVDGAWRPDLSSVSRCDSLASVASSEFIRGAALAPHSTQIDLLLGPEPACALTGPALAAAVARHSAALRDLLQEARRRQQEPPHPPDLYGYDELPVRDPGPVLYHVPPRPFHDRVLAASRPTPALRGHVGQGAQGAQGGHAGQGGRGRGARQVGIRMGRPYRL